MPDLDIESIVDGMIACADNSRKLASDAGRLYARRRYSTAGALAIMSLEESGKVLLLSVALSETLKGGKPDWNGFWKAWHSHKLKDMAASVMDLGARGSDAAGLAIRTMILQDLPRMRERCLYVDREKSRWTRPADADRNWVFELLDAAESLADQLAREASPRRRHLIISQTKEVLSDQSKAEGFLANLLEGVEEIQERISQVSRLVQGETSGFAS